MPGYVEPAMDEQHVTHNADMARTITIVLISEVLVEGLTIFAMSPCSVGTGGHLGRPRPPRVDLFFALR